MSRDAFRIAVVGGIAVGKSSIIRALSERLYDYVLVEEDVSRNMFLPEFYDNMQKWAFHSRISTLAMITENSLVTNQDCKKTKFILDRCVDELITFAKMHYENGNMSEKEFAVYCSLYTSIVKLAPPIDLFIYCECSPERSLERIKQRGRELERNLDLDYIERIHSYYDKWLSSLAPSRVRRIDTNNTVDIDALQKIILDYEL